MIGSQIFPKTAIFIRCGELEKVPQGLYRIRITSCHRTIVIDSMTQTNRMIAVWFIRQRHVAREKPIFSYYS